MKPCAWSDRFDFGSPKMALYLFGLKQWDRKEKQFVHGFNGSVFLKPCLVPFIQVQYQQVCGDSYFIPRFNKKIKKKNQEAHKIRKPIKINNLLPSITRTNSSGKCCLTCYYSPAFWSLSIAIFLSAWNRCNQSLSIFVKMSRAMACAKGNDIFYMT